MANIYKGEVDLPNGLRCVFDFYAMSKFEELTGQNAIEFVIKAHTGQIFPTVKQFIALMQSSLVKNHPDKATEEFAASMLDEYGVTFVQQILGVASPDEDKNPKKEPAPRKRARKKTQTA